MFLDGHVRLDWEVMQIQLLDLTDMIFGKLKVIKRVEDLVGKNGRHYVRWECQCMCHKKTTIYVLGDNLRSGKVKSCGCLRSDNLRYIRKNNSKKNKYDLTGEYGIGWATNNNKQFLFDLDDFDKIKNYNWYDNGHYIVCCNDGNNTIFMQNMVMNPKQFERVDHIKHNTYDNRKSYLRIGTISDNSVNRIKSQNNTSGTTGVSWHKGLQKWQAYITKNGKRHYLGVFTDIEDAIIARKKAEKYYFGEWSYDNSMSTPIVDMSK